MDTRGGLDDMEKRKFFTLPRVELRPLGRPACSQSLYRLRYPSTDMEGSCEYIEYVAGRPIWSGPPDWGLSVGLTTHRKKNKLLTKCLIAGNFTIIFTLQDRRQFQGKYACILVRILLCYQQTGESAFSHCNAEPLCMCVDTLCNRRRTSCVSHKLERLSTFCPLFYCRDAVKRKQASLCRDHGKMLHGWPR
jgi:hypothetical protein